MTERPNSYKGSFEISFSKDGIKEIKRLFRFFEDLKNQDCQKFETGLNDELTKKENER